MSLTHTHTLRGDRFIWVSEWLRSRSHWLSLEQHQHIFTLLFLLYICVLTLPHMISSPPCLQHHMTVRSHAQCKVWCHTLTACLLLPAACCLCADHRHWPQRHVHMCQCVSRVAEDSKAFLPPSNQIYFQGCKDHDIYEFIFISVINTKRASAVSVNNV